MPDGPSGSNLPRVLPPEEERAIEADDRSFDLARKEQDWLTQSLSEHTVAAAALKNKLAQAYIDNMDADRALRKQYASRILRYLEVYSSSVGLLLILDGLHAWGFHMDKEVVATLVGSTAVAAIGLVGFIARGLFRTPPAPPPTDRD